jgi:hypothetical protein
MTTAKAVATIAVFLVLVWTAAWFAPHGCSSFSAWAPAVLGYNNWLTWLLLGCVLLMVYAPIYDLVAFGFYWLGFEDRFEAIKLSPEQEAHHKTTPPPMTMKDKLIFVYPLGIVVGALIAVMWFLSVRCWPWGTL